MDKIALTLLDACDAFLFAVAHGWRPSVEPEPDNRPTEPAPPPDQWDVVTKAAVPHPNPRRSS